MLAARAAAAASIACLGAGCSFGSPGAGPADAAPVDAGDDGPPPDGPLLRACLTDPMYVAAPVTGRRYRQYTTRIMYDAAIDRCTADGAHLAVVETQAENDYLSGLVNGNNDVWLGLDDLTVEGTFKWITDAPVGFMGFIGTEPNDSQGEDCTYLRADKTWNDTGCEDIKRTLCECDPAYDPPPTPACRTAPGFIERSGRRVFEGPAATWAQARAACEAMGAHLLVIGDAIENSEMDLALTPARWIGFTDAGTEGTFRWVNGATSAYSNWPGGTVPLDDALDCTLLQDGGTWGNLGCGDTHPYACECDPAPP